MLEGAQTDARDKFYAMLQTIPTYQGNPYLIRIIERSTELKSAGVTSREAYKQAYREAYNKWVKDNHQEPISNEQITQ